MQRKNATSPTGIRVCYFGTYRANYARNRMLIDGLRLNNVEVIECHETLWHGVQDRVDLASGGWFHPNFLWRVIKTYFSLLKKYSGIRRYDILMVGYPGNFDVFLARILSWFRRKPLVWNVFMSIYLIAMERKLESRSPITITLIKWFERAALRLPDLLIQDTSEYVAWFEKTYKIPEERFCLIPTGADDRIFHPIENVQDNGNIFNVVYYGSFIPNHGVEYIIEAAQLLRDNDLIKFTLIGTGPDKEIAESLLQEYSLTNINFIDWLEKHKLVEKVTGADVLLGVFGDTPQSLMTVQNKIYEGMAMKKPVISGDSSAVRKIFQHRKHIFLVERKNSEAIVDAIITLYDNPGLCMQMSELGNKLYREKFTIDKIGKKTLHCLDSYKRQIQ